MSTIDLRANDKEGAPLRSKAKWALREARRFKGRKVLVSGDGFRRHLRPYADEHGFYVRVGRRSSSCKEYLTGAELIAGVMWVYSYGGI